MGLMSSPFPFATGYANCLSHLAAVEDRGLYERKGPMKRSQRLLLSVAAVGVAGGLAACSGDLSNLSPPTSPSGINSPTGPLSSSDAPDAPDDPDIDVPDAPEIRVRCEVRTRADQPRSRASVDGKNLAPGMYTATLTSGTIPVSVSKPVAVGDDEVEFDFDSDPGDIAAGDTRIPADFIQVIDGAASVTATIMGPSGHLTDPEGCEVKLD